MTMNDAPFTDIAWVKPAKMYMIVRYEILKAYPKNDPEPLTVSILKQLGIHTKDYDE